MDLSLSDEDRDVRAAQSMAKLYGGVKRWYRELRLLRIYEGTDEMRRRTIARNLIKGHESMRGLLG